MIPSAGLDAFGAWIFFHMPLFCIAKVSHLWDHGFDFQSTGQVKCFYLMGLILKLLGDGKSSRTQHLSQSM